MTDIKDVVDEVVESAQERATDRLQGTIAALVAVLATLMALFNIKDGNIVQAMAQTQAQGVNAWAYFQAKSTKQSLAEGTLDQLIFERDRGLAEGPENAALLDKKIAFYQDKVQRYGAEKDAIKQQAEGYENQYNELNIHDDQFDIAEAGITVSLAMLGIAALTRRRWLVGVALVFALVGLSSGIAGFIGASFHLGLIAQLLS